MVWLHPGKLYAAMVYNHNNGYKKFNHRQKTVLDLTVLPLNLINGQPAPDFPGVYAGVAPKKCERTRAVDQFVALMSLVGNVPIPASDLNVWLEQAAGAYYEARGSVTMGLKAAAEAVNDQLMKRNATAAKEGWQGVALLNLAVIRKETLFLASAGPTHSIFLSSGTFQDFTDELGGRGLGTSKALSLRYYQTELQAGDVLVLCPLPPENWTSSALAASNVVPGPALRKMLTQAGNDLKAVVIQVKSGSGGVTLKQPAAGASGSAEKHLPMTGPLPPIPPQTPAGIYVTGEVLKPQPAEPRAEVPAEPPLPQVSAEPPAGQPVSVPDISTPMDPAPAQTMPERPVEAASAAPEMPAVRPPVVQRQAVVEDRPRAAAAPAANPAPKPSPVVPSRRERAAQPAAVRTNWKKEFARFWMGSRSASQKMNDGARTFAGRVLPGSGAAPVMSTSTMLFIAIAVPLIIAAIATTIYYRSGRGEQHQLYLDRAQQSAELALSQDDPIMRRLAWEETAKYLDNAERYGMTEESQKLRLQANQVLDQMDGIARLNYQPATAATFSSSVNFTRMEANDTDVYLLDSSIGQVLRLFLTNNGYELDPQFRCGPVQNESLTVGPLVDLVALPSNYASKDTVVAIDGNGTLIYCQPGAEMRAASLTQPDNGWGNIVALNLYQGNLFVMDTQDNAVWFYEEIDGTFPEAPRLYFSNQVPVLDNAIDLAVNGEDLFILRSTNQLIDCTFRAFSLAETRCADPAPLGDGRPGREGQAPDLTEGKLIQLYSTLPPDPSLYALDTTNKAILHFSLRLNLQRMLYPAPDPDFPLPKKPMTAFTITPNRGVLVAMQNEIFYAPLP